MPSVDNTGLSNFSYSLFRELGASQDGNLFASTYSIQLLLLLLTVGSKNKTNDNLKSLLRIPNENFIKTYQIEHEDPRFLNIANGIFVDTAFKLNKSFKDDTRQHFNSEVQNVDFSGNPTVAEYNINAWTRNHTKGKITKLFDSGTISQDTKLVLASAVHFKNNWENTFTESNNERFCLSAMDHIQVKMMHQTDKFLYYKDEENKFAAVELPYNGGDFQMLVVLPDVMDGITALEKSFLSDSKNFDTLLAKLTLHKVILTLPKFKFESDLDLTTAMKNLGCSDMFTSNADFSAISSNQSGNLRVSKIKHKSLVDVNEKGTEAVGITGATIVNYMLENPPKNIQTVKFKACHPFLFFIKKNSKIIFMGRLTNPSV